jgi:hypothetical protein
MNLLEEEAIHLIAGRKQSEGGRASEPGVTFKGTPLVTYFLQLGPPS